MELKTARLTLLIDVDLKAAFERQCAGQDRTASQVVRQLIRGYLAEHGVDDVASGANAAPGVPPEAKRPASTPRKAARADRQASGPATRSGARRR